VESFDGFQLCKCWVSMYATHYEEFNVNHRTQIELETQVSQESVF
jgi:hypothetical protein